MKKINLSIVLFFALVISTSVIAQLQYSLDSIEYYSSNGELDRKQIVLEKNQDGYTTKTNTYRFDTNLFSNLEEKSERTYFSNNETKELIVYRCYPFRGSDTCILSRHLEYNELGDRINYFYRSIGLNNNPNIFDINFDFRSRDSVDFYPDGRRKNRYNYRYYSDTKTWDLRSVDQNFYSQDGEVDSIHQFVPDANDLVLSKRTHYQWFPDDLKRTVTVYLENGTIEVSETQYIIIDGNQRFSSAFSYLLNGTDSTITYQSNTNYSDHFSEQEYSYFRDDGSFDYGGKVERYLLEDNLTADTVLFYNNNFTTGGVLEFQSFNLYYYTDRLSSDKTLHANNDLVIYPNPTSDVIFLDYKKDHYTAGNNYMIFDAKGHLVKEDDLFTNQINISNLSSGNYYLKVGAEAVKPFVVQR